MRKKKHRGDRLNACAEFIINDFEKIKTEEKLFDNDNPVHLEIGCGKGRFITETAKLNPNINFLAAEKNLDVLLLAAEKIKNENIKNVKFFAGDANNFADFERGFAHSGAFRARDLRAVHALRGVGHGRGLAVPAAV